MDRRELLVKTSGTLVFISGCTDRYSADSDAPWSESEPAGCDFTTGQFHGSGDPIERTISVESTDELDRRCANEAGTVAITHLNNNLPFELEDKRWIHTSLSRRYGSYSPVIHVEAWMDPDGNYDMCPDPDFSVTEAAEVLPSEIHITLDIKNDSSSSSAEDNETGDETYECTHQVRLEAGVVQDV